MFNDWVQLVDYRRNGISEVTIHGAVAWVHGKKVIYSYGGNVICFGRSMLKPFHMKVFSRELSHLSSAQKAVAMASHNAEAIHVNAAQSLLSKSEWGLMQTPFALPLMQFGRQLRRPRRWYHTCSGEHAAILAGCKQKGWSRVGYVWPHHPFHQSFLSYLKKSLGENWRPQVTAKDGCGLPTVSMTVVELAQLFAGLVRERDEDWVWSAMIENPDMVGGFNRLDSTILKSGKGQVLAKEGADGLLGLSILHKDYPEGLGIVIKIAHGWDSQATWYVARYVLGVLGIELRNPYPLKRQKAFVREEVVPPTYVRQFKAINPFDPWDPDEDRWDFDYSEEH